MTFKLVSGHVKKAFCASMQYRKNVWRKEPAIHLRALTGSAMWLTSHSSSCESSLGDALLSRAWTTLCMHTQRADPPHPAGALAVTYVRPPSFL